jgi:hypothetical protein
MTLGNILSIISDIDKISIHANSGYVLFDGVKMDLDKPVKKLIIKDHLEDPVDQIRSFNDTTIILLGGK